MKKILALFILFVVTTSVAHAERSVSGFKTFDQYREIGDFRLWTFIAKDSTLGTLTSSVKEQTSINGISGFVIEQKLKLDLTKVSTNLKFDILNRHFVSDKGIYLGNKMKIKINDKTEEINLEREDKKLLGYTTRNESKIEQELELGNIEYTFENNYIDQLELFLASLDLTVGKQIADTVFMPQALIETYIYGVVDDFRNIRLYNQVFDSCFVIELTYPTMMTAYFTPDKRLVKLEIPSQDLKIYQDAVANPLKAKLAALKAAEKNKSNRQPIYVKQSMGKLITVFLLYLAVGAVITLFFNKSYYKKTNSYIALAIGGFSFILIPFTQIPLQEMLFTTYFIPNVLQGGESALVWGILPAATAGIIQELVKLGLLFIVFNYLIQKKSSYIAIGALLGFGFGLVEATYLAYGTPSTLLFGMNLVERLFLIMFHISAGTCLGYAFKEGLHKVSLFVLVTILLNSIFRYLPIFAQNKSLTPELLGILLAFISISFFTFTLFITKRNS